MLFIFFDLRYYLYINIQKFKFLFTDYIYNDNNVIFKNTKFIKNCLYISSLLLVTQIWWLIY